MPYSIRRSSSKGTSIGRSKRPLRDAKIDVLVMPYFVDCGSYYAIRGRVVDLSEPSRVHTTYVALHKDHHGELAKQLGN